jgi:hypothetical protein
MAPVTDADRDISRELRYQVSPREVRTLQEYGAIDTLGGKAGGRGKKNAYIPGTAQVVEAIADAKTDDVYARKLHRAVLIAWARGAAVRSLGLRRAFDHHFDAEERRTRKLMDGQRVKDGEPDLRFGPAFDGATAAAKLGYSPNADDIGGFEESTGEVVRAAFWESGQERFLPDRDKDTMLGLAERRSDGTWHITAQGEELWEALSIASLRRIARAAPREELDKALALTPSVFSSHGFRASDFAVASAVPGQIQWMRKLCGNDKWWQLPTPETDRSSEGNRQWGRQSERQKRPKGKT